MSQHREYQGKANAQQACSYSSLRNLKVPQAMGASSQDGSYQVPFVCPSSTPTNYPPKSDTLSHGQAYTCGGYFQLKGAYQEPCQDSMVSRACAGNIDCSTAPAPVTVEKYCQLLKENYRGRQQYDSSSKEDYCGSCSM